MGVIDALGNHHARDGKFAVKPQTEVPDLDTIDYAEFDNMGFDDLYDAQLEHPTAEGRMFALREVLREREYDYVNPQALRSYPELELETARTIYSLATPYTDETGETHCPGFQEALNLGLDKSTNPQIRQMIDDMAHDYHLEQANSGGWGLAR